MTGAESTPGLTEEERAADMEGVSDGDGDASEVSYESEVEYEIDSDEDHHFYESDGTCSLASYKPSGD